MFKITKLALALTSMTVYAAPALAHPGHGRPENAIHGFLHPLSDVDHLLAALSVAVIATGVIVVAATLLWRAAGWMRAARRTS